MYWESFAQNRVRSDADQSEGGPASLLPSALCSSPLSSSNAGDVPLFLPTYFSVVEEFRLMQVPRCQPSGFPLLNLHRSHIIDPILASQPAGGFLLSLLASFFGVPAPRVTRLSALFGLCSPRSLPVNPPSSHFVGAKVVSC